MTQDSSFKLSVSNVWLKYPSGGPSKEKPWALSEVSFSLDEGDRLGVLGLNGAGKSTLLRVLASIYEPEVGSVQVNGKVAALFSASLGFISEATGWENIFLRGAMMGLSMRQSRELAPSIIEFAGLGGWIYRPISEYSSGMALRLAFSISTAVDVDVLLMDEWLGAGDQEFLDRAKDRMFNLVERSGVLILATHNLRLLRTVCNKALLLDGGQMAAFGDIDPVIKAYHARVSEHKQPVGILKK